MNKKKDEEKAVKFSISVPPSVLKLIDRLAKSDDHSRSKMVQIMAKAYKPKK